MRFLRFLWRFPVSAILPMRAGLPQQLLCQVTLNRTATCYQPASCKSAVVREPLAYRSHLSHLDPRLAHSPNSNLAQSLYVSDRRVQACALINVVVAAPSVQVLGCPELTPFKACL